jgi:hypothetical protein
MDPEPVVVFNVTGEKKFMFATFISNNILHVYFDEKNYQGSDVIMTRYFKDPTDGSVPTAKFGNDYVICKLEEKHKITATVYIAYADIKNTIEDALTFHAFIACKINRPCTKTRCS